MQVFISWSGETSRLLAEVLAEWLPGVIQAVRPYCSASDLDKGALWDSEIEKNLDVSEVGLLCVTRDNVNAPWLAYEAGALSKGLDKSRVVPILFGLKSTDIKGPLAGRQAATFTYDEMRKVLRTVNDQIDEGKLTQQALDNAFEKWWPDLEQKVTGALDQADTPAPIRDTREMVEEILQLMRATHLQPLPLDPRSVRAILTVFDLCAGLVRAADDNGMTDVSEDSFRTTVTAAAEYLLTNPNLPVERAGARTILTKLHDSLVDLHARKEVAASSSSDEMDDDLPF